MSDKNEKPSIGTYCGHHPDSPEYQILKIEDRWMETRLQGQLEYSTRLIADSYKGLTPSGEPQNKQQFLDHILEWDQPYTNAVQTKRTVTVQGNNGDSTGVAHLSTLNKKFSFHYRRRFHRIQGKWYLVGSKASAVSPPKAPKSK